MRILVLTLLALYPTTFAQTSAESVEVVQSVPIETTLAIANVSQTQQVWLNLIRTAKRSLDLEQFYIINKTGEALDPVLTAITDAAVRGVKVRIIIDSKFYKNYPLDPVRLSRVNNVQVKVIDYGVGIQHAKYLVADGSSSYVGSANFDWLALSHIHEVGLRVKDSAIAKSLLSVFEKDWVKAKLIQARSAQAKDLSDRDAPLVSAVKMQLVASPASQNPSGILDSLSAIIRLLDEAKTEIKIQVYQYSTQGSLLKRWNLLDEAIRRAAARGVLVKLLVDAVALKGDKVGLRSLSELKNGEVKSVQIPAWSGGHLDYARLIHSKYFIVDNSMGWVGTENWSESYFKSSRNVGIIFQSPVLNAKLTQVFDRVWNSTYSTSL